MAALRTPTRHNPSAARRPRVLMINEGTYPHVVGGVSSWCDYLVRGLAEVDWQILPIVSADVGPPLAFELPQHAVAARAIKLWSDDLPAWRWRRHGADGTNLELPAILVLALLSWDAPPCSLVEALVWCRRRPHRVRSVFRHRGGWEAFLRALQVVLDEDSPQATRAPRLNTLEAATLYQTLYWVARTAAAPTPPTDLLHVTAAGWAGVPAIVHKALHGTPLVVTEHGVYLRESYLSGVRTACSAGERMISTRLARGLARAAYAAADVVSPVTEANAWWERGMGVAADKIEVIHNGIDEPAEPVQAPGTATVVAVGRIDPLKDVHTMLRVAREVLTRMPEAQFLYYGPVTNGQEAYGQSCYELHARLLLGDRFRFMGPTSDPDGALRDADVVLMTSISEGLPMALLEAMAQARPVVSTSVGGVSDLVRGCGLTTAPGDVHALALSVITLLRDPPLAVRLGHRGHARVGRAYTRGSCVSAYRALFSRLTGLEMAT